MRAHGRDQSAHLFGKSTGANRLSKLWRPRRDLLNEPSQQQLTDTCLLLGPAEQPRLSDKFVDGGLLAHEAVRERVKRGNGGQRADTRSQGDARAQFCRGPTTQGEHEYLVRGEWIARIGETGNHRLDNGGGLSGAGPSHHQQRAPTVVDHRLLIGVKGGRTRGDRRLPIEGPLGFCHRLQYCLRV